MDPSPGSPGRAFGLRKTDKIKKTYTSFLDINLTKIAHLIFLSKLDEFI